MSTRQNPTSTGGPVAELDRLKASGSESLGELRDFVGRMQGRSPQEVLGLVQSSSLVRSTCVAAAGLGGLLVVLTIVPWMLSSPDADAAKAAPVAAAAEPAAETQTAAAPADTGATGDAASPAADQSEQARAQQAVEAMGIGEVRETKPGDNPLDDNGIDSLLEID